MRSTCICTIDDIKKLGTILCVGAHPDDETFMAAGILAAAVRNGQEVACITATRGEAGVQDESRWPAVELADIRTKELEEALRIIGIQQHYWLGFADGCCYEAPVNKAVEELSQLIDKINPQTILTFGPDGSTGHPDHQTVSHWVSLATEGKKISVYHSVEEKYIYEKYLKNLDKQFNIFFNIKKPLTIPLDKCDIAFQLPPEIIAIKHDALKAMPSQTEAMLTNMPRDHLKAFMLECFISGDRNEH